MQLCINYQPQSLLDLTLYNSLIIYYCFVFYLDSSQCLSGRGSSLFVVNSAA